MKMYYCDSDNFGDALNRYIFKKCFNVEVERTDTWAAESLGIGSIMENLLWQVKDILKPHKIKLFNINNPVKIFSSGFGRDSQSYRTKPRFFKSMIFKRKIEVVSLRGELTRKQIAEIDKNIDLSRCVLGDMGLLSSYLLDGKRSEKSYELGCAPHGGERNHPVFDRIMKENPGSVILDTRGDPVEFLKKLDKCKAVISTGMHPLIAADSLGIPNMWCRISEFNTPRHKYYDYYSIYPVDMEPVSLLTEKVSKKRVVDEYKIKYEWVQDIKNNLYSHHKTYFENRKTV